MWTAARSRTTLRVRPWADALQKATNQEGRLCRRQRRATRSPCLLATPSATLLPNSAASTVPTLQRSSRSRSWAPPRARHRCERMLGGRTGRKAWTPTPQASALFMWCANAQPELWPMSVLRALSCPPPAQRPGRASQVPGLHQVLPRGSCRKGSRPGEQAARPPCMVRLPSRRRRAHGLAACGASQATGGGWQGWRAPRQVG